MTHALTSTLKVSLKKGDIGPLTLCKVPACSVGQYKSVPAKAETGLHQAFRPRVSKQGQELVAPVLPILASSQTQSASISAFPLPLYISSLAFCWLKSEEKKGVFRLQKNWKHPRIYWCQNPPPQTPNCFCPPPPLPPPRLLWHWLGVR